MPSSPAQSAATPRNTPFVLIIRDGWGQNPHPEHDTFNAIKIARTPVADELMARYPTTLVKTSGEDVGLPEGTMGNSEVGHQNIGAGRVVDQESVAITKAARRGFEHNDVLRRAIEQTRDAKRALHVMGIASDAGVHGQLEHLYAILRAAKTLGLQNVLIHLFTDGRDTGPFTGKGFVGGVLGQCAAIGVGRVVSIMGRYYAMDRDDRWERVSQAYGCMTGRGEAATGVHTAADPVAAVQAYYDHPTSKSMEGDEFITPTAIGADDADRAATRIAYGDTVIFYNYRGDRPREIIRAFRFDPFEGAVGASPDSGRKGFDRGAKLDLRFVTMTAYDTALAPYVEVAFPKPPKMKNIAGEYLSSLGLRQFRCAETEKGPHVTFFFNDYREAPFPGESRVIPRSAQVATYDLKPEMSAEEVCQAVLDRLDAPDCEDFIVVNFANGDMVGHTGKLAAAVKACEVVDACVGRIVDATLARNGALIVTADHGNSEQLWNPETHSPHTAHTTYDVPLIVVGKGLEHHRLRAGGRLADILPTALTIMGLPAPPEMTGESLLVI